MREYRLTKHATKTFRKIKKSNPALARRIKNLIVDLSAGETTGEKLQGHSKFEKNRVGKYRLISTVRDDVLIVAIVEKRETVYETFEHLLKNSNFLDV